MMEGLMTIKSLGIALIAASGLASSMPVTAFAGPIPTMAAAVAQAVPNQTIDVYWRGYGPGLAFGFAAGALAGAAIAGPGYGGAPVYYYGAPAPYPYARPVYLAPYATPGAYAPPVYPGSFAPYGYYYGWPSRCYTQEGYGRYRSCSAN
jgi:hypothetical protein